MKENTFLSEALGSSAYDFSGEFTFGESNFRDISTDSRTITNGCWFLPIVGEQFDGHDYIEKALSTGAKGCFANREHRAKFESLKKNIIFVDDTLHCFQKMATYYLSQLQAIKIGITGSAGKTTLKNLVYAICSHFDKTVSTPKSFNNEVGVPKTAQLVDKDTRYAVFELAARHMGDIKLLTQIVEPDIVLCTNVGTAHLGEFGSIENLFNTKMEIFKFSPAQAIFIVNNDDPRIVKFCEDFAQKKILFGKDPKSDVVISPNHGDFSKIQLMCNGDEFEVEFPQPHQMNGVNAAAALAIAYALGLDLHESAEAILSYKEDKGRYSVKRTSEGQIFIDDSYNANPESMMYGLETVKESYKKEKKLLILGEMLELGDQSQKLHEQISEHIKNIPNVFALITIGNHSAKYADKLPNEVIHEHFSNINDFKAFIEADSFLLKSVDLFYLKSSLGVGLYDYAADLLKRASE